VQRVGGQIRPTRLELMRELHGLYVTPLPRGKYLVSLAFKWRMQDCFSTRF
jgi:hypothetical protein